MTSNGNNSFLKKKNLKVNEADWTSALPNLFKLSIVNKKTLTIFREQL